MAATTTLTTASSHYEEQQQLAVLGAAAARRAWGNRRTAASGPMARRRFNSLIAMTILLQERSAANGTAATAAMLSEQHIDAPPAGTVVASALAGAAADLRPLATLFEQAESASKLVAMVTTEVADAGRTAQRIATAIRPGVDGYVRYLNPPSCSRCTILAGRFYRWSEGFDRHTNCDCVMIATGENVADELIGDPQEAFRKGQISDLTQAETKALDAGADMAKVINATKRKWGVYDIGSGLTATYEGTGKNPSQKRLTPASIFKLASDRDEAIRLLARYGYIK